MLQTNIKDGVEYSYQDIRVVKGVWYAWYYKEIDVQKSLENSKDEQQ